MVHDERLSRIWKFFGNSLGNTISSGNSLGSWILGKDVGWKFVL